MNRRSKPKTPARQKRAKRIARAADKLNKPRQSKRIRQGDTVVVIAGNDRGKKGTVEKRVGTDRLVVQGVNVRKKAVKPSEANPQGGFLDLEVPIHASNVMLCTEEGKGFRPKTRVGEKGKEIYGTVGGAEVSHRAVKAAK